MAYPKGHGSPNPGGFDKKRRAARDRMLKLDKPVISAIAAGLKSDDIGTRLEAAKIAAPYIYPRQPQEIDAKVTNTSTMTTAELYAAWRAEHPKAST